MNEVKIAYQLFKKVYNEHDIEKCYKYKNGYLFVIKPNNEKDQYLPMYYVNMEIKKGVNILFVEDIDGITKAIKNEISIERG